MTDEGDSIALREAWQRHDPVIERDAELFWRREGLLAGGSEVETRLSELCVAAYEGETLVALTTGRIRYIEFLGCKLAMVRGAVAAEKREQRIAMRLQARSREVLEEWSLANPAKEIMGMGVIIQARNFKPGTRLHAFRPASRICFIGWTANGEQMRVAWFEHATIPLERPVIAPGAQDDGLF